MLSGADGVVKVSVTREIKIQSPTSDIDAYPGMGIP
jgi:hypothetical protein